MTRRCLLAAFAAFALPLALEAQRTEADSLLGAPYRIDVPADWNGGLVMYAHGYQAAGRPWSPLAPAVQQVFLDRGFAVAQSGYASGGWALEDAVDNTEQLRRHFATVIGQPDSTFITGHSMGGLITVATIERFAHHYDGALPLCGAIGPSLEMFEDPVFDMLVTFDHFFGDLLPEGEPLPDRASVAPGTLRAAMDQRPDIAETWATRYRTRTSDVPGVLAFLHLVYRELVERAGGHPIDNRSTVYSGFGDDGPLNAGVRRYAADTDAVAYVARYYTPSGDISDPVLAVHTVYDPVVSPDWVARYDAIVTRAGRAELFAARHVDANGHCTISPQVTGEAFDALRAWAATGGARRP